jgi:uncharacterized membrane protein YidH (DUF202 family)
MQTESFLCNFNLKKKVMDDVLATPAVAAEAVSATNEKKKKEEKKEEKKDLTLDKLELSLYRAQLAMIRTATTTTSLGFALYKLIEQKAQEGTEGPLMKIFTPKFVALILFFAGILGLITYSFRHTAALKKINRFSPKFYYSGVMLVSYIILLLTLLLFVGMLING